MAVKIIEEGKLQTYEVRCLHCLSTLEFTDLDEQSYVSFEGNCTDWYIKCPKCNYIVPTRAMTDRGYYEWRKERGETQ